MPIIKPHDKPLSVHKLYKRINEHRETEQLSSGKGAMQEDAPLKFKTRLGRTIYFHRNIGENQVQTHNRMYLHFEELVKQGKFPYNPISKTLFRRNAEGTYYAFDPHNGTTVHALMLQEKLPRQKVDDLITTLLEIESIFEKQGIYHGHLHLENLCLNEFGQLMIIDSSLMTAIHPRFGGQLKLDHLDSVINTICHLLDYKFDFPFKTAIRNLEHFKTQTPKHIRNLLEHVLERRRLILKEETDSLMGNFDETGNLIIEKNKNKKIRNE